MKKKILSLLLVLCLVIPCFLFTACGNNGSESVMTLSVNPNVSFVVDGNDKVVSVSYGNEDAGYIYANVDFNGMDVNSAIQIFVEQSVISGHFELTGDQVTVNVTGSVDADVSELLDTAKAKVEEVAKSLGITVTVNAEKVEQTILVETAKLLAPDKTDAEIEAMESKELIALIKDRQNEYKGLAYDQINEIKKQFDDVNNTMLEAIKQLKTTIADKNEELDALLKQYGELIPDAIKTQIEAMRTSINDLNKQVEAKVKEWLAQKDAAIAEAKKEFEAKKTELVNQFKDQVNTNKTNVLAHLELAKNNGEITEAQYNYYVELINKYTPQV